MAVVQASQLSTTWIEGTRRRRLFVLTALVVGLSLILARFVLAFDIGAVAGLSVFAAVVAITVQPRNGLYLMLAVVLFFDGVSLDPLMLPGHYLNFSLQTTLNLNGAILIPIEMVVLLTSAVWLAQAAMRQKIHLQGGFFGRAIVAFLILLIWAVVRGLVSGAIFNYSFWESRFLFALVITYFLTVNTLRTRAHLRTLLTIVFVFVALSAVEAIWRRFVLVESGVLGDAQEDWYSHEDVIVWGMLLVLVLAQGVFGASRWQRIIGPLLLPIAVTAMLVSERRAGLIAVMIACAIFTLSLIRINRRAFFMIAIPALLASLVYFPLFWNNTGTLGQVARAVRSLSSPDPRDAASNAWRDLEAINVRATIASDPVLGIGFGRPFLQIVAVPDISSFEFWNYEAHHNILWVWMKTGAFGFIAFFTLILGAVARSIWLARSLTFPESRTLALLCMSTIVMAVVFCYVDLGLSSTRVPLLLGICLGTLGTLDRIRN